MEELFSKDERRMREMFQKSMKLMVLVLLSVAVVVATTPAARAAGYPDKPIKVVVPADAGSGEDTESRGIAPFLQNILGVAVQIENQPGAGGKISLERFQKTTPDGYTIICNNLPKSIIYEYMAEYLYKAPVQFKTKEFSPIFAWSVAYNLLIVNAESPWKTFDDFWKAAKEKTLSCGLSAIGGTTHLGSLAVAKELGIKANWVPFEGMTGNLTALAGKHLDFSIVTSSNAIALINAGKLRPLLMFADERDPFFPDVPTAKEMKLDIPTVITVRGVQAPPKTPPAIVKTLQDACAKAILDPAYIEWAKKRQMTMKPMGSAQYMEYILNEGYPTVEKYQGLMKEALASEQK
jgi:tripartite-type tricarboxylate transporter receptor subunit TctC